MDEARGRCAGCAICHRDDVAQVILRTTQQGRLEWRELGINERVGDLFADLGEHFVQAILQERVLPQVEHCAPLPVGIRVNAARLDVGHCHARIAGDVIGKFATRETFRAVECRHACSCEWPQVQLAISADCCKAAADCCQICHKIAVRLAVVIRIYSERPGAIWQRFHLRLRHA